MVQAINIQEYVGIVDYRPRVGYFVLHGDKVILQVCEKFVIKHPCDGHVLGTCTKWRDARVDDFVPPSIPNMKRIAV